MSAYLRLASSALFLFALVLHAREAQADGWDSPKFSDEVAHKVEILRKQIEQEIESLEGHHWAGEYYAGDGLGTNIYLSLAPESGFTFEWRGCLGTYDRNFGQVEYDGHAIQLTFVHPNKQVKGEGLSETLIPISWGDRKYLIPPDEMVRFANDVNSCKEPRSRLHGLQLLRRDDHEIRVEGFPELPEEFNAYLLEAPIETTITGIVSTTLRPSIMEWNFKDITVALDKGQQDGLLPKMTLHVAFPDDVVNWISLTEVRQTTAEGTITMIPVDDGPKPETGWRLSTAPRWGCRE